jgi:hypothetical protein
MTTVNIAFSGGVESVYLLQLALERGFNVNLCLINVHNALNNRLAELIACEKIIKYFETRIREDQEYLPKTSWKYAGQIKDIIHVAVCPWVPSQNDNRSPATFEVTQQFSTILGMMYCRREYLDRFIATCWIGWIKQDASEFSCDEHDHSEEDYGALLRLPQVIGPLSNADNIGVQFRAPLWEMDKLDIYNSLEEGLKELLIPNGSGCVNSKEGTVTHTPYSGKVDEWRRAGIPTDKEYVYDYTQASWMTRYVCGSLLPADVEIEDTPATREMLCTLSPFFSKGRTVIRPNDHYSIKREIKNLVHDLIRTCQAMTHMPTKEELDKAKRKEREEGSTVSS